MSLFIIFLKFDGFAIAINLPKKTKQTSSTVWTTSAVQ